MPQVNRSLADSPKTAHVSPMPIQAQQIYYGAWAPWNTKIPPDLYTRAKYLL